MASVIKIHEERIEEKKIGRGERAAAVRRLVLPTPLWTWTPFSKKTKTNRDIHVLLRREVRLKWHVMCRFCAFFEQTRGDNCTVSQPSGLE